MLTNVSKADGGYVADHDWAASMPALEMAL